MTVKSKILPSRNYQIGDHVSVIVDVITLKYDRMEIVIKTESFKDAAYLGQYYDLDSIIKSFETIIDSYFHDEDIERKYGFSICLPNGLTNTDNEYVSYWIFQHS